ncbi:MAG: SO_0444 family Cu/Zn efflux transporter [Pseudomonadota bacterium]
MDLVLDPIIEAWRLFQASSIYVLFGILVAGLLRIFLPPEAVAHHLGRGKFLSVFKAALIGIPLPLCSCGVLPAAASLKRQGANNGATTAFLISTPESGVDSIAITYAMLDPVMTIARPTAAFATAALAGLAENFLGAKETQKEIPSDPTCPVDSCCTGIDCPPEEHSRHHTFKEKVWAGLRFAIIELWGDMAVWFLVGIILAGMITTFIPSEIMTRYLGGGLQAMLIMLAMGIPLYICATASTPIAAAFILTGVSPGAALVFLLAGPATNITSLTVLLGILGKRATAIYLSSIAVSAVGFGLIVDQVYSFLGLSARAMAGQAVEIIPDSIQIVGALILLILSLRPVYGKLKSLLSISGRSLNEGLGCASPSCSCQHEGKK